MGAVVATACCHGRTKRAIGDSTAKEVVGALLKTLLPNVQRGIGMQLLSLNKDSLFSSKGGLPLGDGSYRLLIVRKDGDSADGLSPDDIIETMRCEAKRVYIPDLGTVAQERSEETGKVLCLDLDLVLEIRFAADSIAFKLEGQGDWWKTLTSPDLDLTVKDLHVQCKVRLWYHMLSSKLWVAFLKDPKVQWDIDLRFFEVGIPMPDFIEDTLLALTLQKVLGGFTVQNPLKIPILPDEFDMLDDETFDIIPCATSQIDKSQREAARVAPAMLPQTAAFLPLAPQFLGSPQPTAQQPAANSPGIHLQRNSLLNSLAADVMTGLLDVFLPVVKRGIGMQLLRENRKNKGLLLNEGCKLQLVRKGTDTDAGIKPDDIIRKMEASVRHAQVATFEALVLVKNGDDKWTRIAVSPQGHVDVAKKHELELDLDMDLTIQFGSYVEFQLRGQDWHSPNFGLAVSTLKTHAKLNMRFDALTAKLAVAFYEPPIVQWDLELRLLPELVGIPIPDFVEDSLLASSLCAVLGTYGVHNPIVIPIELNEFEALDPETHDIVPLSVAMLRRKSYSPSTQ